MVKNKWKNNIGIKILAIVFATFLWWTVVNVDDPLDVKKYSVDVTVTNPEVVTNAGKSFQVVESTRTVTVSVKARRKVLDKIKKADIIATADLRELQDSSVPIRLNIIGFEDDYEEISAYPRNLQVNVENTQKKTFPITAVATGTPSTGHVVGNMTVSPKTVDISGPESVIKKIAKVVAKVDVSEMKDNAGGTVDGEFQTNLLYYDAADNLIDKALLTSNCDKKGVVVSVDIWKTKTVKLNFDTSAINVAKGYILSGIEVEPKSIEVAGEQSKLNQLAQINIGKNALATKNLSSKKELLVDIKNYLPEGVFLADENAGSVAVRILVEKAGTKSIQLPTGSITVLNAPEDLQLTYEQLEVELTFTGTADALAALEADKIEATIDLKSYNEKGVYEVTISVSKMPEHCSYNSDTTVTIELKKK